MKEKIFRFKKPIIAIALILIIFGITLYTDSNNEIKTESKESLKSAVVTETTKKANDKVYIDIKGAVKKPGVYEMDSNYRVIDVVNVAGGFTKYADTSVINLGKKIKDQMVIIIYTKSEITNFKKKNQILVVNSDCPTTECVCPDTINDACITTTTSTTTSTTTTQQNTSTTSSKVSINRGTIDELQTLTGIGLTKAQAIIDYRTTNGNFTKLEDLLNVSGIGTSTYDKIKDYITL